MGGPGGGNPRCGATYQRDRLAALLNMADLVEAQMAATAFQEPLHAAGA